MSVSDGDRTAPTSSNSDEQSSTTGEMRSRSNQLPVRNHPVPNIPAPINGMIKTYDYSHRTFTRPHSAKTVFFYNESDEYFAGVRVPVSKARYRNMEALMDDLNVNVPMPFGVRRLVTPFGRTPIRDIDQLQHLGKYVCSSTKWARRFNMSAVERMHKARMAAQNNRRVPSNSDSLLSTSLSANSFKEKTASTMVSSMTNLPIQILFVVNGRPSRVYRSLLRPNKGPSFDSLLQEVSEGLQLPIYKLFTFDGRRVLSIEEILSGQHQRLLACQRHERPLINVGNLPPLPRSPHHVTIGADGVSTTQSTIESRSKSLPPTPVRTLSSTKRSVVVLPRLPVNRGAAVRFAHRSESFVPYNAARENSIERPPRKPPVPRRLPLTIKKNEQNQANRETSSASLKDNDLLKKSSPKRKTSAKRRKTVSTDAKQSTEEPTRSSTPSTEKAVIKIQAGWRGHLARRQLRHEHKAATKIQKHARKYLNQRNISQPAESEEDRLAKEEKAATVIQAAYRGYLVRKNLKESLGNESPAIQEQEADSGESNAEKEDDEVVQQEADSSESTAEKEDDEVVEQQEADSSESTAEKEDDEVVVQQEADSSESNAEKEADEVVVEQEVDSGESNAEKEVDEVVVQEEVEQIEEKKRHSKKTNKGSNKKRTKDGPQLGSITYTVSVCTGNRWAADTDADLYIILHGENSHSEKHWLKQASEDPKFGQNQVDTFEIQSGNHGSLTKIVIGHEKQGYGAGIFIERVLVTENIADGRQFFFTCAKWFDSQQVDGKIERTIRCIGFYHMTHADTDPEASNNRWELTVHTGDSHGNGGTTANLSVTGFGSYGMSEAIPISNDSLDQAGSASVFQVSFGDIGELYKIRFETDGSGSNPDYYLDFVELTDMDTGERMTLRCGKWLSWVEKDKDTNAQPFRELSVVRTGVEPLSLIRYEGTITSTEMRSTHLLDGQLEVQIIGEFGETGSFPVAIPAKVAGSLKLTEEIPFKVDAVSVGRIRLIRLSFPVDESGEALSEGFALLQSIYDKHNISAATAVDWVVHKVVIRESPHAPYRFVFGESHVLPEDERNGVVRKDLLLTEMEGLPTKVSKKRSSKRQPPKYVVSLTTGETADAGTNATPFLTLCGDRAVADLIPLVKDDLKLQPGTTTEFDLNTEDVGLLYKVRVRMESPATVVDRGSEEDTSSSSWYLKKLRVRDAVNGDELRFPVEMWLDPDAVIELPAVWPDTPPLPLILYQVTVYTGSDSPNDTDFIVFLNIFGRKGDIGRRNLRNASGTQQDSIFKPSNADTFDLEAVSVQDIESIEIGLLEPNETNHWFLDRVQIHDPDGGRVYVFDAKSWFSASKADGLTERKFPTTRVTEDNEE